MQPRAVDCAAAWPPCSCREVCEFASLPGACAPDVGAVTVLQRLWRPCGAIVVGPPERGVQANHQQIGRRYVEVFASTAFEKDAACERNRATMRDDAGYREVLP